MVEEGIIDNAVKEALQDIEKNAPEVFKKLSADPKALDEVKDAARQIAAEELKMSEHFPCTESEIATQLSKHLPETRVKAIKEGLAIPTYQMRLNKRPDGKVWADITREGKTFMPSVQLDTTSNIDIATYIQMASIIVEAVLLGMSAAGITVEVSDAVIQQTAEEGVTAVESSSVLQQAVQNLEEAFENGTALQKATAIFNLIKDTKSANILWTIVKGLCKNMSWVDWLKTSAMVSAMLVAVLATDGVALIAKIVLALNSAYEFVKKVANISELKAMRK